MLVPHTSFVIDFLKKYVKFVLDTTSCADLTNTIQIEIKSSSLVLNLMGSIDSIGYCNNTRHWQWCYYSKACWSDWRSKFDRLERSRWRFDDWANLIKDSFEDVFANDVLCFKCLLY